MAHLKELHKQAIELEGALRLLFPVLAIKMIKKEEEIPKDAKRPVKDFGHHLSLCQAYLMTARANLTIAETKEDMWCMEPVLGLGFEKPPKYFLDGHNRYPESAKTLEAGVNWARNFPRFRVRKYKGIVIAPLKIASFKPDIFMTYVIPGQLLQLLLAKNWLDGYDVKNVMSGHAGCVYSVVPVIKGDKIVVSCPCPGMHVFAALPEFYMVFSAPIGILRGLLDALSHFEKSLYGLPYRVVMKPEYEESAEYAKIARMIGMDWVPLP